jgi:hypothetical protein
MVKKYGRVDKLTGCNQTPDHTRSQQGSTALERNNSFSCLEERTGTILNTASGCYREGSGSVSTVSNFMGRHAIVFIPVN